MVGQSCIYFLDLQVWANSSVCSFQVKEILTKDRLSVKKQIRPEFLSLGLWKNFENVPVGRLKPQSQANIS